MAKDSSRTVRRPQLQSSFCEGVRSSVTGCVLQEGRRRLEVSQNFYVLINESQTGKHNVNR